LAKTDAIDAAVIVHFPQAVRPPARPLPDELALRLAESMARGRHLVVMINAEKPSRQSLAVFFDQKPRRDWSE
jgi:transposase